VSPEQVVLGNGSSEILELVARAFLTRGTSAVYSQYAFIVYPMVTSAAGATGITAPASAFGNDPQALLDAIREDTRVLFLANPNNPTGTLLDLGEILDLIARVPRDVIVVLDEAYYEYLPIESAPPSVAWLDEFPNLLIARTFSKAYGLAGLRVGFALCHRRVADSLNAIRQPFNVNTFAQSTALAALGDNEHLARSVAMTRSSILQLTRGFAEQGIDFIPSNANFVTFRPGDTKRVHRGLADQGILVRELENYGMPDYLRVSAGLPAENARFLLALAGVLPDTGSKS
jgi:histidinol-phosphate aminotransferase